MRILALDAALARCSVAVVIDDAVAALRQDGSRQGQAALLAPMAQSVLDEAGVAATALDGIAVCIGPGSFTGLRASIALAQGIALAAARPVVGVTLAEAFAASHPPIGARILWTAIDSRRGRVFLDQGNGFIAVSLQDLPPVDAPVAVAGVAVAGDAAVSVAGWLAGRNDNVMLTDLRLPAIRDIAAVGALRLHGELPPLDAQPLYIDPPEAKLPAGGLRPAPVA